MLGWAMQIFHDAFNHHRVNRGTSVNSMEATVDKAGFKVGPGTAFGGCGAQACVSASGHCLTLCVGRSLEPVSGGCVNQACVSVSGHFRTLFVRLPQEAVGTWPVCPCLDTLGPCV